MVVKIVILKTEFFIARRILKSEDKKSKLSKPIVLISLASIVLGVAIMLVTVSVITGFQDGIRNKVIGFGSHIQITKDGLNKSMESAPILIKQDFIPEIKALSEVKTVQAFGYKPAILQSFRDSVSFELASGDTNRSSTDIKGVLFKGVDENYDWDFFKNKLIAGRLISFENENNEILISEDIARLMGYQVNDHCDAFFIRDNSGPKKQKFQIVGIYNSGFEEFDKKLIFTQINHIQTLNNWGVQSFITLADTCINNQFVLKGITTGGSKNYKYHWGMGYYDSPYFLIPPGKGSVQLISSDFEQLSLGRDREPLSLPDTSHALFNLSENCHCNDSTLAQTEFISSNLIRTPFGDLTIENGNGTHHYYSGGFEVILNNWDDLDKMDDIIYEEIPYDLKTTPITEMHRDIFAWLDLLDMNIAIIIVLILVVSLINMITSLLVLILEKTNMIGILKAVGGSNKSIRYIFIYHALFLLIRGLFWGNVLGLGLLAIQHFTGFIQLDATVYSLDTVPVSFNLLHILYINSLTVIICFIVLILPSYLVSKINPIKAIRFD